MIEPTLFFILTIVSYLLAKRGYKKWPHLFLQPILICPLILITLLLMLDIPYQTYNRGAHYLSNLLIPATVAFAVPLYQNFETFKKYIRELTSGIFIGTLMAIFSSYGLSIWFHLSDLVAYSMVPRSVTTPIAMDISKALGADPTLTAVFVVLTAIIGIVTGPTLIRWLSIHSPLAKGAMFGTAAHGIGTAKAFELGDLEGTISSISMIIAAIITLILVPILIPYLPQAFSIKF